MKKFILTLLLSSVACHAHDFAFYKQKTRELLPLLEINESDVTFTASHKEVSPEERMKKQNTIFLDLEKLNALPDSMALFECAVSAQLTKLDWSKIDDFKPRASILQAAAIPLAIGMPSLAGIIMFLQFNPPEYAQVALFSFLSAMSCLMGYFVWRDARIHDAIEKPKKIAREFAQQELWLRFSTFYTLLDNNTTTHIAIMGIPLTALHKSSVINSLEGLGAIFGLTIISEWEKLLMRFGHWTELHPQDWERIQKQLNAEKQAFDAAHIQEKTDE